MGLFDAAVDAFGGTLADQWKDIVTAAPFDEHVVVAPGVRKRSQDGRGANYGSNDVLSNGSFIYVPENTAAFIFSRAGIEQVITQSGGYEYRDGVASVFDKQSREETGIFKTIADQTVQRIGYGGMAPEQKRISFVNLREIRGIRFGTRGPLVYNDAFYGTDLEIFSYGMLSVQVVDAEKFVRSFVPPNVYSYSFDDRRARNQLMAEFLSSFISAINGLSSEYRVSQLPSQSTAVCRRILEESDNAGTWEDRFGIKLVSVAVENVELSDDSRELIRGYSQKKMDVSAYEGVSEHAANIAAQQKIAEGVRENGFGDAGGMLFGMGFAGGLDPRTASQSAPSTQAAAVASELTQVAVETKMSFDEQVEALKKLKELVDAGILTQEEFDNKKREVMGL